MWLWNSEKRLIPIFVLFFGSERTFIVYDSVLIFRKMNNVQFSFQCLQKCLQIYVATEIRCQEKSKGGLCYEVILGQPAAVPPMKQIKSAPMTKTVSAAQIERKLSEAEKRRLVSKDKRCDKSELRKKKIKKNRISHAFCLDVGVGSEEDG